MRHELRGRKEGSRGTWGRRSRGRNMSTKEGMTDSRAIKGHPVTNDSKCQGDKFGLWWNCLLNTCVHTCKSGCSWLWSEKVLILLLLPFGKDFFFFMCMSALPTCILCITRMQCLHRSQEGLERELQTVVSRPVFSGNWPWIFYESNNALNFWANSPSWQGSSFSGKGDAETWN